MVFYDCFCFLNAENPSDNSLFSFVFKEKRDDYSMFSRLVICLFSSFFYPGNKNNTIIGFNFDPKICSKYFLQVYRSSIS
ncbi:hypothetical protein DRF65_10615 [Chryseobacterium pennae]|uniref:Uncharacterized protein n=1 Tax=Chryseobacterium pennae TaxID=2258962 RepID=A0A3D9C9H9_9FLAO|nr:hypothetical protein DRF65_10615 [Chryseobacterium pennae]